MTLVTPAPSITVETRSAQHANQVPASLGLVAGEALLAAAPCYIKASDGKVWMSDATAANEAAEVDGFTGKAYAVGEPVTLWGRGVIFEYATGMTIGADLYVGATAGRLDTAATVGDGVGVARTISATHIRVTRDCPLAVGSAALATGAVTFTKAKVFVSAETTATGSAQNVAHGLGVAPAAVLVVPTEHPGTPDTGAFDIAEGTHTTTNVVVTVTANVKFKVLAWA